MSITFTGTGGLFTQLGVIGALIYRENLQQATLHTRFDNLPAQYTSANADLIAGVMPNAQAWAQIPSGMVSALTQLFQNTIIRAVFNDVPAQSTTLSNAIKEVIRQMNIGGYAVAQSVTRCTVSATAAAVSGVTGDGVLVATATGSNGLPLENIVVEVVAATCTSDSQTGGASVGQEKFTLQGQPVGNDPSWYLWPQGSAATGTLTAVSALSNMTGGNLLNNSGFDSQTTNVPNNFTLTVGTAGTDIKSETAVIYDTSGTQSIKLVGNAGGTAVKVALYQQFNNSGGTTQTLTAQSSYSFSFRAYADVVPAAGVITIELIGGASTGAMTVQTDAQGNNCAVTFNMHSLAANTTWYAQSGTLRTPVVMPAVYALNIRVSTAISTGSNVYLDHLAMTAASQIYPGGPLAGIFSGATKFINGDRWTLTDANDYASSTDGATFQTLFDRMCGMRSLGLLLPSSGSPSLADSLITT